MKLSLLLPFLLLASLAACGHETSPTPMRQLPTLERPVVKLDQDAGRGNVAIPTAALATRGSVPGVFVLSDTQQARFRMVRPGPASGKRTVILSGLQGDETLVLGDLTAVHDGSPIKTK